MKTLCGWVAFKFLIAFLWERELEWKEKKTNWIDHKADMDRKDNLVPEQMILP